MAGLPDNNTRRIAGWPAGVNNRVGETELPTDEFGNVVAAREAVNVDFSVSGKVSRRDGYTKQSPDAVYGMHATDDVLFTVAGGELRAYTDVPLGAPQVVRAGMAPRHHCFATSRDIGCTWWSDGEVIRMVTPGLSDATVWSESLAQCSATAAGSGGLAAGEYQVACTYVDTLGRESGTSLTVLVSVPEGGGVLVSGVPDREDVAKINIYMSPPDGDVLYLAQSVWSPMTSVLIGAQPLGRELETQWHEPMPPGHLMDVFAARLFVARENVLFWSASLRYGLTHMPSSYTRFSSRISMVAGVADGGDGAGLYVADATRVYFMSGADPKNWQRASRYPAGVVEGTAIKVPASLFNSEYTGDAVFWVAQNGTFCLGMPSGNVLPLTEKSLALPGFERGAAMLREKGGLRSVLMSMLGSGPRDNVGARDSAVLEVRRHGVII